MASGEIAGFAVNAGLVSHAIAAIAFFVLVAVLLAGWKRGALGGWLMGACAVTMLWAAVAAYESTGYTPSIVLHRTVWVLDLLRSAGWIAFLLIIVIRIWTGAAYASVRLALPVMIGIVCLLSIGLESSGWGLASSSAEDTGFVVGAFGRVAIAIIGLLLVENLFRNNPPVQRWRIKYLCVGLGGMFAFDFFVFSEAMLFHRMNVGLLDARGLALAMIVPLIAVSAARNPVWSLDVFVSRQIVFHSTTLVGAGVYLLAMAAAGFYLRRYGGQWGIFIQAIFLFTAIIFLLLVIFSGGYRAWLKVFINKHFFSYKYDYREEWLRVISTMSSLETAGSLPVRVVEAVAEVVDSPEGALWLQHEANRFSLLIAHNCAAAEGSHAAHPGFAEFLETRRWVIDLDEAAAAPDRYNGLVVPEWLTSIERGWLVIPLLHHERLFGVMLLCRPRAPKTLNWEDYDLLRLVGRQAAGYLAEQTAARSVAESRQFDQFNRRFAFVIHDIKNLVSQLSLMLSNAEKHRNNPEFQEDMFETVRGSVEKLNRMLVRLHEGGKAAAAANTPIELCSFLRQTVERNSRNMGNMSLVCQVEDVVVLADEERLAAVMAHMLDNALDVVGEGGVVTVRLSVDGPDAIIEIEDDGPGMAPEFVRDELFRPFRTTKESGYGIGAYESREFVRDIGGRLDITSAEGVGTTVRISLPAIGTADDAGLSDRDAGAR